MLQGLAGQAEPEDFQEAAEAEAAELNLPTQQVLLQEQAAQAAMQKLEFGYLDEQLFCN
jgi:predicted DNA-binding WGR domain protein